MKNAQLTPTEIAEKAAKTVRVMDGKAVGVFVRFVTRQPTNGAALTKLAADAAVKGNTNAAQVFLAAAFMYVVREANEAAAMARHPSAQVKP